MSVPSKIHNIPLVQIQPKERLAATLELNLSKYTRVFDPSEYGYLSLTLVTISLLSVFAYGQISASIARFLPKFDEKENEKEFYTTSFIVTLLCRPAVSLFYCIGLLSLKAYINQNLFKSLAFGVLILILSSF
jgi:O-antigen/teichoic acid export membrane protein